MQQLSYDGANPHPKTSINIVNAIIIQVRAHPSERLRYCDKILPGEVTEYYFDM